MIYKPTLPSPYAKSISIDENAAEIPFSFCMLGENIGKTRLKISDGKTSYYYDENAELDNSLVSGLQKTSHADDGYVSVLYHFNMNSEYLGYEISQSLKRSDIYEIPSSKAIQPSIDYTWQIRLYDIGSDTPEYKSNIWLAYGSTSINEDDYIMNTSGGIQRLKQTVSSYAKKTTYSASDSGQHMAIPIRPHTNIFFQWATGGIASVSKRTEDGDIKKLYIRNLFNYYDSNAKYYIRINGYYKQIVDYKFFRPTNEELSGTDVDIYGAPKLAYAIIEYDETLSFDEGDTYEIYCNYIDSDEFYFSAVKSPTFVIKDIFGQVISGTEANEIDYSVFYATGEYFQPDGATVSYYEASLMDSNGNVVHRTGKVYNSSISYSYDRLENNEEYTLEISVSDTNGFISTAQAIIHTNYRKQGSPSNVSVYYNAESDSNIIDFSNIASIPPRQLDDVVGYKMFCINEHGDFISSDGSNVCKINEGNSFIYDTKNNTEPLSFGVPVIYTTIKLDKSKTGILFRVTDDDGIIYSACWDGVHIIAEWDEYGVKRISKVSMGYESGKRYAWNDEDIWNDANVWVDNSPLSESWHRIIMTINDIYVVKL